MKSKSKLKKIASKKREQEHEKARLLKEKNKELMRLGTHPSQIETRKQKREADVYHMRHKKNTTLRPVVQTGVYRRETPNYPSVTSTGTHTAEKRERDTYTGDKLLGIAMMHKSNLVPIFNPEHAKDISTMRRN